MSITQPIIKHNLCKLIFSSVKCKIKLIDHWLFSLVVRIGKVSSNYTQKQQLSNSVLEFNQILEIPFSQQLLDNLNSRSQKCEIMLYRHRVNRQKETKQLVGMASINVTNDLRVEQAKKIRLTNSFDKQAYVQCLVRIQLMEINHSNIANNQKLQYCIDRSQSPSISDIDESQFQIPCIHSKKNSLYNALQKKNILNDQTAKNDTKKHLNQQQDYNSMNYQSQNVSEDNYPSKSEYQQREQNRIDDDISQKMFRNLRNNVEKNQQLKSNRKIEMSKQFSDKNSEKSELYELFMNLQSQNTFLLNKISNIQHQIGEKGNAQVKQPQFRLNSNLQPSKILQSQLKSKQQNDSWLNSQIIIKGLQPNPHEVSETASNPLSQLIKNSKKKQNKYRPKGMQGTQENQNAPTILQSKVVINDSEPSCMVQDVTKSGSSASKRSSMIKKNIGIKGQIPTVAQKIASKSSISTGFLQKQLNLRKNDSVQSEVKIETNQPNSEYSQLYHIKQSELQHQPFKVRSLSKSKKANNGFLPQLEVIPKFSPQEDVSISNQDFNSHSFSSAVADKQNLNNGYVSEQGQLKNAFQGDFGSNSQGYWQNMPQVYNPGFSQTFEPHFHQQLNQNYFQRNSHNTQGYVPEMFFPNLGRMHNFWEKNLPNNYSAYPQPSLQGYFQSPFPYQQQNNPSFIQEHQRYIQNPYQHSVHNLQQKSNQNSYKVANNKLKLKPRVINLRYLPQNNPNDSSVLSGHNQSIVNNSVSRVQKQYNQSRSYEKFNSKGKYKMIGAIVSEKSINQTNSSKQAEVRLTANFNISQTQTGQQEHNIAKDHLGKKQMCPPLLQSQSKIQNQHLKETQDNEQLNDFLGMMSLPAQQLNENSHEPEFQNRKDQIRLTLNGVKPKPQHVIITSHSKSKLHSQTTRITLEQLEDQTQQRYRKNERMLKRANQQLLSENKILKKRKLELQIQIQYKKELSLEQFQHLKKQLKKLEADSRQQSNVMQVYEQKLNQLTVNLQNSLAENAQLKKTIKEERKKANQYRKILFQSDEKEKEVQQIEKQLDMEYEFISKVAHQKFNAKEELQEKIQFSRKGTYNDQDNRSIKNHQSQKSLKTLKKLSINSNSNLDRRLSIEKTQQEKNKATSSIKSNNRSSISSRPLVSGMEKMIEKQSNKFTEQSLISSNGISKLKKHQKPDIPKPFSKVKSNTIEDLNLEEEPQNLSSKVNHNQVQQDPIDQRMYYNTNKQMRQPMSQPMNYSMSQPMNQQMPSNQQMYQKIYDQKSGQMHEQSLNSKQNMTNSGANKQIKGHQLMQMFSNDLKRKLTIQTQLNPNEFEVSSPMFQIGQSKRFNNELRNTKQANNIVESKQTANYLRQTPNNMRQTAPMKSCESQKDQKNFLYQSFNPYAQQTQQQSKPAVKEQPKSNSMSLGMLFGLKK